MRTGLQALLLPSIFAGVSFAAPYGDSLTALWARDSCVPQTCVPSGDTCDFYQCVESEYHCESTTFTYPIEYGFKYCNKFGDNKAEFSPAGQQWIHDVRLCLQDAMMPVTDCSSNCQTIQTNAFNSHPECYAQAGVCTLFQDWINIFTTVGIDGLLAGGSQIPTTAKLCAEQYAQMGAMDLLKAMNAVLGFLEQIGEDARNSILGSLEGDVSSQLQSLAASVGLILPGL